MAKGTLGLFFFLTAVAFLLLGINIGKRIPQKNQELESERHQIAILSPVPSPSPKIPSPTSVNLSLNLDQKAAGTRIGSVAGTSTYSDKSCGFSFSYPGSFIKSQKQNGKSVIFTSEDETNFIAVACQEKIPKPPVDPDNIESIILDGQPATLYHDKNPDGNPRDEVIVKHPTNELEIIIAGYGKPFQEILSSFKFL